MNSSSSLSLGEVSKMGTLSDHNNNNNNNNMNMGMGMGMGMSMGMGTGMGMGASSSITGTTNAPMSTTYLFRAKTSDAYIIKILIELLHNNIKTGCFEISTEGIHFCMTDSNRRTLIHCQMFAKDFNLFMLHQGQKLNLGLNINHFYKMLKSIKKKDCVILFITEDRPTELGIQIIPKDHSRLTISYIRIQNIQNLEIQLPEPYPTSILVSASEFSKMCKDMFNISNTITILSNTYNVKFICNLGSVYSREVILGETDQERNHLSSNEHYTFEDDFDAEQMSRIMKISGLSANLNIHCVRDMPMMIRSKIGSLGTISIYVKSKKQIEEEEITSEMG
jgi:proliferating cell nuclear antigen